MFIVAVACFVLGGIFGFFTAALMAAGGRDSD